VSRWTEQEIGDMLRARRGVATPRVGGVRPRQRWPELRDFFTGALRREAGARARAEARVAGAISARDPRRLAEIDMSLRELRARGWGEHELARALEDLGMEYLPYADGRTYHEWVAWVHHEVVVARE
jgi:hypothetical protein